MALGTRQGLLTLQGCQLTSAELNQEQDVQRKKIEDRMFMMFFLQVLVCIQLYIYTLYTILSIAISSRISSSWSNRVLRPMKPWYPWGGYQALENTFNLSREAYKGYICSWTSIDVQTVTQLPWSNSPVTFSRSCD